MSLLEQMTPRCDLRSLALPDSLTAALGELLEDFDFATELEAAGLTVRRRILLHGPPGCGKTSIAHGLAAALKIKLCFVPMAEVVEGTVGASEKQAVRVFDFAAQNKCVVLLDEFDSIASSRLGAEHAAEMSHNRLVNALLTSLENKPPLGLVVACTNFLDAIDRAVLRRFDLTLEVPTASRSALRRIAEGILKGRFGISVDSVIEEASTPAAVVRVATDRLRRKVIENARMGRAETVPMFDGGPEKARRIRRALAEVQP